MTNSAHLRRTAMPTLLLVFTLAAVQLLLVGQARAVTFGDDLTSAPAANSENTSYVPAFNFDGSEYAGAPIGGVLTSVRLRTTGTATTETVFVQRRVGAWSGGYADFKKMSAAIPMTVTADSTTEGHVTEVLTREPIAVGDVLGLEHTLYSTYAFHLYVGGPTMCGFRGTEPPQAVGTAASFNSNLCNPWHPMLQGTIEPDADGDGFGDETQDRCPTDAARQAACPPVVLPAKLANITIKVRRSTTRVGTSATRTFTITNEGGATSGPLKARIRASKPALKLSIIKGCKPDAATKRRTCTIPGLAPGASVSLKVSWTPKSALKASLTAAVTTATEESSKADNIAKSTVTARLPK